MVGKKFTSWGDHLPLVPLYNNPAIAAGRRVTKHRQQVQDFQFSDKYLKGKQNPCDYKSRHPTPISDLSTSDREKLGVDDSDEVTVMRLWVEDMPMALSVDTLKEAAAKDQDYQELVERVKTGQVPAQDSQLYQYHKVWPELSILDGLVMRGDKIVIPQTDLETRRAPSGNGL